MNLLSPIPLLLSPLLAFGQTAGGGKLSIHAETEVTVSQGDYAPLWLSANRYGMGSTSPSSWYLRAGADYEKDYRRGWNISAGIDMAGGVNTTSHFWLQQAYFDTSWRMLTLSIGSKERISSPLEKNTLLTSGWMMEGINTRPIPQIRAEIRDFYTLPFTRGWLALKGHLAYGAFLDGKWQESFAGAWQHYARDVKYHSKALMFRVGNKSRLPLEFEFGLHMGTQFCGDQMQKQPDGSSQLILDMPDGLRNYFNAFFPTAGGSDTTWGEQVNVEGNMLGSWNFALNYYYRDWKFRLYLDHYFEDESQMFTQYGIWKDGQLGLEVTFPSNPWITSFLWEGTSTTNQTSPLLYDAFAGSFTDLQMSGADNYYNHYIYQAWQYYGMGLGCPLLPGPAYNADGAMTFRSNRMKAHHIGLSGNPAPEWNWRVLASFARHWGTYGTPFRKVEHRFSGMAEVLYTPRRISCLTFKAALGIDRGSFPGNSIGGTIGMRYRY